MHQAQSCADCPQGQLDPAPTLTSMLPEMFLVEGSEVFTQLKMSPLALNIVTPMPTAAVLSTVQRKRSVISIQSANQLPRCIEITTTVSKGRSIRREEAEKLVKLVLQMLQSAAASPDLPQQTNCCLHWFTTSARLTQTGASSFHVLVGFVAQASFHLAPTILNGNGKKLVLRSAR